VVKEKRHLGRVGAANLHIGISGRQKNKNNDGGGIGDINIKGIRFSSALGMGRWQQRISANGMAA